MQSQINIGDPVIFNSSFVETFVLETNGSKELKEYQKLVLGGLNQVGIIKEFTGNLTTVVYPDGWELPVPTKYLLKHHKLD